jgi:hypothetical protein
MKMKSLKSVVKFWQEVVFIIPIVFGLTALAKEVLLGGYTMDGADIFLVCCFLPLLICLIGQFFWKSEGLAICLSVLLGTSAFVVILMALYGISTTSIKLIMIQSIIMLIWGVIGIVAAIAMSVKNLFKVAPDTN